MMRFKTTILPFVILFATNLIAQKPNYSPTWEVKNPFEHNVFIENKGQFPDYLNNSLSQPALYYSVKGNLHIFFSQNSFTIECNKPLKNETLDKKERDADKKNLLKPTYLKMTWEGANPSAQITVEKEVSDYFTYPNPTNKSESPGILAHAWSKLTYHNLYAGIDVEFYYPENGGFEMNIIAHQGADISKVKIHYDGAKTLLKGNDIYISSDCTNLVAHIPVAKDENNSDIQTSLHVENGNVSFKTAKYDSRRALTISTWVSSTSFNGLNSAFDIGYDVSGNVYVFGGGSSTEYQLQKYNSTGTLQWTYTPSAWPEGGGFYYYYGDLVTDTRNGDCYVNAGTGGGFSIAGAQIDKVGPSGSLIRNFPGDPNEQEMWRMDLDYCHNLLVIGAGDAGSPPYQAYTIDTAFAKGTPVNVLGTDSAFHDMALLALDQTGNAYMATSKSAGGASSYIADNVMLRVPIPALAPTAYQVSDGYGFVELSSIKYYGAVFGGYPANGMNGMVANKHMVVTYDGANVKKWTTTGTLKKTVAVSGASSFNQGGLDMDCQGHIYAGNGSVVTVYDSTLGSLGTISAANTVYDLKAAGNGLLYACGKTFVGAYKNTYSSKMVTVTSTPPTACAACNGQATANVSCGSGNYSYKWSNGATTSTATGLCQGIYYVTVTDNSTCGGAGRVDTASVKFILPGGPTVSITSTTEPLCNGGSNGSATASASGGTGPYTYSWSPTGGTNATGTNLSSGTYTVTVKNGSGCISIDTVTILQPSQIAIGINVGPSCSGNNGSATAVVSGGTGTYTYSWAPSGGTNATASGLAAGTYTVTVKDKNGCIQTGTAKVGTATGTSPTLTPHETGASCSLCNGTASVSASGGTAPYTYNWSNGLTTSALSNLCGGTYTVTVSSAGDSVIVPFYTEDFGSGGTGWTLNIKGSGIQGANPNKWVIDNNNALCNSGNYLHVACSGSVSPYFTCTPGAVYDHGTPSFDNSATDVYASSPNISTVGKKNMLLSFTYECDGNSSVDYSLVSFSGDGGTTWNDQPKKYDSVTTCTKVTVPIPSTYNGLSNFRYGFRWINKGKGNGNDPPMAVDSITIGSKAFVTGCPTTQTVVVPPVNAFSVTVTPVNASCGSNNGSATASPTPTGSYTYKWSDGQTTQTASSLTAGTYTVIVSVSGGCSDTSQVTISNSGGPAFSSISRTNELCNGNSTGNATANVTGGVTPYTYSWNNGQTTSSISSLAAGTYTCTVKDKNGCQVTDTVIITQPSAIIANVTGTAPANCGSTNGSATVSASGGTGTLRYSWNTSPVQTTTTATGLAAGNYTCTVTDANGCTQKAIASVSNTGGPSATISGTSPKCNGGTGTAEVNVSGGASPYTYSWSPTGGSKDTASGLSAGLYTCTVTDKNGCLVNDTITISQPSAISGTTSITNASCGKNDGSATVTASGGTGAYTYNWSAPGGTTATLNNVAAGSYSCTVTDANGCSKVIVALINNAGAPSVTTSQSNEKCFGDKIGSATVNASGGSGTYTYSWNNGATTSNISGLSAGTYTCVVTDSKGCQTDDTVKITQPTALASTISPTNASCGKPGSATVNAIGGTSPYTYKWSPTGGTSATAPNLVAGSYSCIVTDADSCTQQLTTTITGNAGPVISISNDTTIKSGNNVTIIASGGGTYQWSPATGLSCTTCASTIADPTKTTSYCVFVTDSTGCADSACMTINVDMPCGTVFVPDAFSPNGDQQNDLECVYGNCIASINFSIFDRWGNEVFSTTDPQMNCWDGKYKGQLMNSGVFVYYLNAVLTTGEKVTQKGSITLVR